MGKKRILSTGMVGFLAVSLAGCLGGGGVDTVLQQTAYSVYSCGEDGRLSVRRLSGAIEVLSPRGIEVRLPASPPGQTARYGAPPYALVFDNREALWFVTGKRPLSCRR
ncbi:MAG: hypothetical protein AB3N20_00720 [Rhizobiaceae bacterium]